MDATELIIDAPRRRRKEQRFTPDQLATFKEAFGLLPDDKAIKVGEALTENDARTIARDAQRELKAAHGIDARTSVFKVGTGHVAALRRKSGSSGGPGVAAGNSEPEPVTVASGDVAAWTPDMIGAANPGG
jgi:hypothetical protein